MCFSAHGNQSRQPLGDGAFRPMQTGKKDAGRFTNLVSDDRAFLQLEVERSLCVPKIGFG
jgi:hypothetical protein